MLGQTIHTTIGSSNRSTLFSLVYASSAIAPFSKEQLVALLEVARRNNAPLGVSGLLLYADGNFMQALEGEESIVRELHSKIARDPRHTGVITLIQGPIEKRSFSEWSMGFRDLKAPEIRSLPGFSPFLDVPLNDRSFVTEPSRSLRLLSVFRDKMR